MDHVSPGAATGCGPRIPRILSGYQPRLIPRGSSTVVPDLDLRKVRYFLAVAEQLNFGRAAETLHIAQPVLSRQIRALEHDLGARLFVRGPRGTVLTAAGEQLLADAPALIEEAAAVRRRVGRAGGGGSFVVGFMPGLTVTGPVRALRAAHPDLSVDVVRTNWDDQVATILDGRVDVGYLRMPVDQRGLHIEPLMREPRVVVFPAEHRLAGKGEVEIADLADEVLLQDPDAVPEWRDLVTGSRRRLPGSSLPAPRTVEEKLEHVAAGRGIVVLPASTAAYYRRPDIAQAVVRDIGPNQVCLAWRAGRRAPLVHEFAALAHAAHPPIS
jgi:DNA-binding transcriptional LysR family regulator